MDGASLFERELARRGVPFALGARPDEYEVTLDGRRFRVDTVKLTRRVAAASRWCRPTWGGHLLTDVPSRDVMLLWSADRMDLVSRFGPVVSREYLGSPYPLSSEVLRIADTVSAVGSNRL